MRLWNTKTNDSALLNLRAMNDVERNARLANLEQKITGTNNEILTGPIRVNPRKHGSISWKEISIGQSPNILIHL